MKNEKFRERPSFTDVRDVLETSADTFGDAPLYSFRKKPHDEEIVQISYNHFREDVHAVSSYLHSIGCHGGRHCVIIGKMSYDFAVMYYAALISGAVFVPLDPEWSADDLAATAARADADYLFIDEAIADKASAIEAACRLQMPHISIATSDEEAGIVDMITRGAVLYAENPKLYHESPIDPDACALIVFTSGTTGQGKGVMLSQRAVISSVSDVIPYVDYSDKTISVLPPHHTYCSSCMILAHPMFGAHIYISSGLRYIQRELKEQKPGHLVLVPLYLETFYRRILATAKDSGKDKLLFKMIVASNNLRRVGIDMRKKMFASVREAFGGNVRMIISGGAPINDDIVSFFDAIGIAILNGYGITECAPIVAVNRTKNIVPGSVGTVIDCDTVKIENPNEDDEGEICVKGPNVMLGYYKDEAATAEVIDEEGFFHTGDYGKLDKNNVLYITGRKKNLIILSNGKNVYPEEIENELIATPGILDVIVYEGQSRRGVTYNAIVAEVYPDKDYIEKNGITDIKAHLQPYINAYNKNAVSYKKIKILRVRAKEFPKNTLRKIMRFQLDTSID